MPVRGNGPGYEANYKEPLAWNSILIPKSTTSPSGLAENLKKGIDPVMEISGGINRVTL